MSGPASGSSDDPVAPWAEQAAFLSERVPVALIVMGRGRRPGSLPRLLHLNPQALTLLDLTGAQVRKNPGLLSRILHPEDRGSFLSAFETALQQGIPLAWEGRTRRSGPGQWIRIEAVRCREVEGATAVWEGVIHDITASRNSVAQVALAITEAIPVGTYTMVLPPGADLAHFSFLSERFLQICGLRREDALADPLRAFACVHPDDLEDWVRRNAEVFAAKAPFTGECRLLVRGDLRWVRAESVPRELPDGSTVWEGVLIDVTDRVRAQQQLQASEAKLRQILDNLPISVLCQKRSPGGELVFLNPRLTAELGYAANDIPTTEAIAASFFPDPVHRREMLSRWLGSLELTDHKSPRMESIECEVFGKDGNRRDVVLSSMLLDDLVVSSFLDISARKQAERALAASLLEEREREEAQRRLLQSKLRSSLTASAVAHEINQPLSTIRLLCERAMLEHRLAPRESGGDRVESLLNSLLEESERVVAITEKMRMLLRNVETKHEPVDLTAITRGALTYIKRRLHDHRVRVELRGFDRGPVVIAGDPVQIQIAIGNLLRNASEALLEQAEDQRLIRLHLLRVEQHMELRLADSGSGFPPSILSRNEENQGLLTSTKATGSGLGLYVVRTTLANHGGSVTLGRCRRLGGAEVRLRFPLPSGQLES